MTRVSLLALAVLVACTAESAGPAALAPAPAPQAAAPMPAGVALIDLSGSIDGLRTSFNAHRGEARFLTLLSPS